MVVQLSNGAVFEWWSENQTEKTLFMVQNVRYSNGPNSQVTLPFEYWTPILSCIQIVTVVRYLDSRCICTLNGLCCQICSFKSQVLGACSQKFKA